MTFAEMLRGSPLNQQRMADDNAMNLAGMLARGRAGTVRQEPSLLQEIGGAITDYAVPDRYSDAINPSVMNPQLGSLTGVKEDGTPYSMADAPNPVPMLMDTMPMAGITAWHGSPHKFSKFDMSKIGTGEGAQAYGHGLYAAENPKVAKEYLNPDANYKRAYGHLNNRQEFIKDMMDQGREKDDVWKMTQEKYGEWVDPKDLSLDFKSIWSDGPGNLYKVDIPDDQIAKMLDWDKNWGEQSNEVRELLGSRAKEFVANGMRPERANDYGSYLDELGLRGEQLYERLGGSAGDYSKSSQRLKELGIPGIKYLDQGSRQGGKSTSNFVLFADEIAKILERNGLPIGDLAEGLQGK